ncbi:MAG: hypothetical protein ACKVP7_07885 [Hyphomicrobiaceae bacterium]
MLTVLATVTPRTNSGLACWAAGDETCRSVSSLAFVIGAQLLAALAVIMLMYHLAHRLSGRSAIALLATGLSYLSLRLGQFAGFAKGDIWYVLFLLLYFSGLTEAVARRSPWYALASGAALGMSILFQPLAAVLALVTPVQIMMGKPRAAVEANPISPMLMSGSFVAGIALSAIGLLWLAIGASYDGTAMLRHVAKGLSERVAFVGLERSTWFSAVVTSVPWIGEMLSGLLPVSELRKLSIGSVPGSLAFLGAEQIYPNTLAAAGGDGSSTLKLLLRDWVMGNPYGYVLSIVPVLARGVFAGGGIIALAGLFHLGAMLAFARAEDRLDVHLLVLVPVATLLAVNVLFTGNAFWLNPMLPFVYAYAIAYVSGGW